MHYCTTAEQINTLNITIILYFKLCNYASLMSSYLFTNAIKSTRSSLKTNVLSDFNWMRWYKVVIIANI